MRAASDVCGWAQAAAGAELVVNINASPFFAGLDLAMMVHPSPVDSAVANPFAVAHQHVQYRGKSAHAAAYPDQGVNANDAFLIAQMAGFAGMRIEPEHGNGRFGDAEILSQCVMHDLQGVAECRGRDGVRNRAQGNMRGQQGDPDDAIGQHHHYVATRLFCQQAGSARIANPARIDRRLVDRAGHQSVQAAIDAGLAGPAQGLDDGGGIGSLGHSERRLDRMRDNDDFQAAWRCRMLAGAMQCQRQLQGAGGALQGRGIAMDDQLGIPFPLGGKYDKFRPDARRLARDQCQSRARCVHGGVAALRRAQPPLAGVDCAAGAGVAGTASAGLAPRTST